MHIILRCIGAYTALLPSLQDEFVNAFYVLAAVIVAHLVAVIVTELHEGGSITSAMLTGRKLLDRPPEDLEKH